MSRYIETRVGTEGTVLIEISDELVESAAGGEVVKATPIEEVAVRAQTAFNRALDITQTMASAFVEKVKGLKDSPDQIEFSFGLKIDAGASALVAKTNSEAQFIVKVKWNSNHRNVSDKIDVD
jgi:Trypsin-co-occurring domain 1